MLATNAKGATKQKGGCYIKSTLPIDLNKKLLLLPM
jgi:hypothetical protein